MEALFNSAVRVERMQLEVVEGRHVMTYVQATDPDPIVNDMLQFLKCRLDMNFVREGKDMLPAAVAGRAPDRVGVMLAGPDAPIRAGDRLVAIENEQGKIPVEGTFEIRPRPDEVVAYADRHHIEVQVVEVGQELTTANWPGEEPFEDPLP